MISLEKFAKHERQERLQTDDISKTLCSSFLPTNYLVIDGANLVNARWVFLRLVPIENEQDSVVLFLLTFRDVTAYRQPVEDDFVAASALGAFAAASDPGSSWGRFARLVFSMVRQRVGSVTEKDDGDETTAGDVNTNSRAETTNKAVETNSVITDQENSESNHSKCATVLQRKRDSLPATCDAGEVNSDQRLRPNTTIPERSKSECFKITDRTNFYELQKLEEAMCRADDIEAPFPPQKRSVLRRMFRTRSNVVHTSVSDTSNHSFSLKRTGSTRISNSNPDSEEYSNTHWLSSETAPKYRLEPPCPPKHVLLHYSAFRTLMGLRTITLVLDRLHRGRGSLEISHHTSPDRELHSILDGLRIIRLLRIGRAARRIDQYLEYVSTLLLLMIVCFFLLAHWFACAWYAVGVLDLENKIQYGWIPRYFNDSLRPQNWNAFVHFDMNSSNVNSNYNPDQRTNPTWARKTQLAWGNPTLDQISQSSVNKHFESNEQTLRDTFQKPVPLQNSVDKWSAYLTALYFSLSLLTTIGFGNVAAFTEAEKMLSICCMLIGALVYATIFGNVTTIVQQMYSTRARYNEIMKGVKDFLRIHDVPQELGERVIDYITSSWSVNKGIDTAKVLNYCPKDMQADISVHLNRCVFNSHSAFRLASDGCRRSLAVNFQTLHTAPGDLIFHQGESVDQLCFIASGSLEVLQDDEVIAILSKGDVFGNPSWRNTVSVPSAASVRALTYCTLHTIRLERLRAVLQFYHAFSNSFTRNLELTHNLCNRVIFRKLADVKREMELSMRRNKDPPLSSLPAGHPVRKLISRLRRPSQVGDFPLRQGLSTILSGDSSFDGSELDNSSISASTLAEPTRSRQTSAVTCIPIKPGTKSSLTESHTLPNSRVSSPGTTSPERRISISPTTMNPLESNSQSLNVDKETSGVVDHVAASSANPARKWARLISKATQPKLQNLNEESTERSCKASNTAARSAVIDKPGSNSTNTVEACSTNGSSTFKKLADNTTRSINVNPITIDYNMFKEILGPLEKYMTNMHEDLKQQLTQVIQRIDKLEGQLVTIVQQIPQPAAPMETTLTVKQTEAEHDIVTVHRPRVRLSQISKRRNEFEL
ncbi:Potassium voltage-gated channel protein eag [Fasciola gigantica]|uniref:Potassium voltage-gated channel protein eag n=1 Tax=Fasciola gigantica TaxID=46835 RepID=A0A504YCJ7_FASGI|nr:Potassium voltage-gated channel protein eag [Fasciola gigantica]